MSALVDYFTYPHRRPGVDHDRFPHRTLANETPVAWPGGAKLLLWITIQAEHFPMDMPAKPFLPIGGMDRPPPSVWDYTSRDYGNRVGIFRIMKVLDRHGVPATVAMNAALAERYPLLVAEIVRRGWEVAASGVDMAHLHHGGLAPEDEEPLVRGAFETLRRATGMPVVGWHSPNHSQSARTPDLVAANGGRYIADWINDDMPYGFRTDAGPLVQLPLSYELSDRKIMVLHNQSAASYEDQIAAAFDCLYAEADRAGGRILSLSLSPWVIGQPSRIARLDRLLSRFFARDGVAAVTGADILRFWTERTA